MYNIYASTSKWHTTQKYKKKLPRPIAGWLLYGRQKFVWPCLEKIWYIKPQSYQHRIPHVWATIKLDVSSEIVFILSTASYINKRFEPKNSQEIKRPQIEKTTCSRGIDEVIKMQFKNLTVHIITNRWKRPNYWRNRASQRLPYAYASSWSWIWENNEFPKPEKQ